MGVTWVAAGFVGSCAVVGALALGIAGWVWLQFHRAGRPLGTRRTAVEGLAARYADVSGALAVLSVDVSEQVVDAHADGGHAGAA